MSFYLIPPLRLAQRLIKKYDGSIIRAQLFQIVESEFINLEYSDLSTLEKVLDSKFTINNGLIFDKKNSEIPGTEKVNKYKQFGKMNIDLNLINYLEGENLENREQTTNKLQRTA